MQTPKLSAKCHVPEFLNLALNDSELYTSGTYPCKEGIENSMARVECSADLCIDDQ